MWGSGGFFRQEAGVASNLPVFSGNTTPFNTASASGLGYGGSTGFAASWSLDVSPTVATISDRLLVGIPNVNVGASRTGSTYSLPNYGGSSAGVFYSAANTGILNVGYSNKIINSSTPSGAHFLLGSPGNNSNTGFVYSAQPSTDANGQGNFGSFGAVAGDRFGSYISANWTQSPNQTRAAISAVGHNNSSGRVLIIGTTNSNPGNGANWSIIQNLVSPDPITLSYFGICSDMSLDGSVLVISESNGGLNRIGRVWVFNWSGSSYILAQELINPDSGRTFGNRVCINRTGKNCILVSEPDWNGAIGRVWVYLFNGTSWILNGSIDSPNPGANYRFGYGIAITHSGGNIYVGEPGRPIASTVFVGCVYCYVNNTNSYNLYQSIESAPSTSTAWAKSIGHNLATNADGSRLVVGALSVAGSTVNTAGSAAVYKL